MDNSHDEHTKTHENNSQTSQEKPKIIESQSNPKPNKVTNNINNGTIQKDTELPSKIKKPGFATKAAKIEDIKLKILTDLTKFYSGEETYKNQNISYFINLSTNNLNKLEVAKNLKHFWPVLNQNEPKFTENDRKIFNENEKIKENYYKMVSQGCNYCDFLYSKESIDSMPKKKVNTSNITKETIKQRIEILNQIINSVKSIYEDEKTSKILEEYKSELNIVLSSIEKQSVITTSNSEIILFYTDKINLNDESFDGLSKKCESDIETLLDYSVVFYPLLDQEEPSFTVKEKEIFLKNENIKNRYYKMIKIGCENCGYKYPIMNNEIERIRNENDKDTIMEILIQMLNSIKDIYLDEKSIKMLNEYLTDLKSPKPKTIVESKPTITPTETKKEEVKLTEEKPKIETQSISTAVKIEPAITPNADSKTETPATEVTTLSETKESTTTTSTETNPSQAATAETPAETKPTDLNTIESMPTPNITPTAIQSTETKPSITTITPTTETSPESKLKITIQNTHNIDSHHHHHHRQDIKPILKPFTIVNFYKGDSIYQGKTIGAYTSLINNEEELQNTKFELNIFMPLISENDPLFTEEDKNEFNNDILIKESYKLMINALLYKYGYRLTNHYVHHINEKITKWKGKEETVTTLNRIKNSINEIYNNNNQNNEFTDTLQLLETIILENTKPLSDRKISKTINRKLSINTSNSCSSTITNTNDEISIVNFYKGKNDLNGKTIDQYLTLVGKTLLEDIDFYTDLSIFIPLLNQQNPPFTQEDKEIFKNELKNIHIAAIYLILSKYGYKENQNRIEHINGVYEKWKGKKETVNVINQMKKSVHDIYIRNKTNEDEIINHLYEKLDEILSENTPNVIIQNTEPTKLKITTNTSVDDDSSKGGCCVII